MENNLELDPPSLPDGFYKILAVLAAIELKPSLLAIDEIENSLHKGALEFIFDELRNSESTVILTTHSSLVVDIVRLEDLLVVERSNEGTVLSRIKEPEKLRKKLAELKISQSDSWLFGEFK
jgi:predicted ATPase